MTFASRESSRAKGHPVSLLRFTYGENVVAGYTDHELELTVAGQLYRPVPMEHDAIRMRGLSGRNEFTVRVPSDTEVSQLFRFAPPPTPVAVAIFQGHIGDPDNEWVAVWTGQVVSVSPGADLSSTINCEWTGSTLRRLGATRNYQHSCPHALYGSRCRANRIAATVVSTITAVNGRSITLAAGWNGAIAYDKYINGTISWDTPAGRQHRSVLEVSGAGEITLGAPPPGATAGLGVQVTLGCNRLMTDCANLHNNIANFGGFAYIPDKNPVERDIF